jgi:Hemingway/CFA97
MSTFDGKCLSYDSSKHVVNREPKTERVTIERMYRCHRERLQSTKPVIDDHLDLPNFSKEQNMRDISRDRKQKLLQIDNERLHERLMKAERKTSLYESAYTESDTEYMRKHMATTRTNTRLRKLAKIERENEDMERRLRRIHPKTSIASMVEWYKDHERVKGARCVTFAGIP